MGFPHNSHRSPDWDIISDLTLDLRAERSGTGDGRRSGGCPLRPRYGRREEQISKADRLGLANSRASLLRVEGAFVGMLRERRYTPKGSSDSNLARLELSAVQW